MPETIEGLKFRVSAEWLRAHLLALAAHYDGLLERQETLLLARIEKGPLKPEAVQRANAQASNFSGRARFWRAIAGLLGDADRLLAPDDLSGMVFPIPKLTDDDLLRPLLGEPQMVEIPLLLFRRGRGEQPE